MVLFLYLLLLLPLIMMWAPIGCWAWFFEAFRVVGLKLVRLDPVPMLCFTLDEIGAFESNLVTVGCWWESPS